MLSPKYEAMRIFVPSGEGINRLEEREAMKVGIPRDDAADAVLAHEDRRVSAVEQVLPVW